MLFLFVEKNSFGIIVKFIYCNNDYQICFFIVFICVFWVQLFVVYMIIFSDFKFNMDIVIVNEKIFGRV